MTLLLALFEFIFGCRHHHLSRVFTIKHRTYQVCFDCGREFDLPDTLGQDRRMTLLRGLSRPPIMINGGS